MRHVALVAINFVREQRLPILVLMLWVVVLALLGLVVDLRIAREDVLLFFKQLALYGIAFAIFFGASAIYNERKTRRILAVLSKGIRRGEYIAGLLAGITLATAVYCIAVGVTGSWVLGGAGFPVAELWFLMLCLALTCLLSATVAVLFSTFLNPLFATLAAAAVLSLPAAAAVELGTKWGLVIPAYSLFDVLMKASFAGPWTASWTPLVLAAAEAVGFALVASWIFARRDIAVAVG